MNTVYAATVATTDGPFTILANDEAVLASGWSEDLEDLASRIHPSLRPEFQDIQVPQSSLPGVLQSAASAVAAYYEGDLDAPTAVPVLQKSGPFREHSWQVLRTVGPHQQITYSEYASMAGNPAAARAVASACSHNAAALFVPCHRIVRTDGTLGGFLYGLHIKRSLLEREA